MTPLLKSLLWFWAVVLSTFGTGATVLQILGPPATHLASAARASIADRPAVDLPRAGDGPGRAIAAPDRALMEPAAGTAAGGLPKIATDGRRPMDVYSGAGPGDRASRGPRVALMVAGLGLSAADSDDAIRSLPAAITLAFSPYAQRPEALLEAARDTRHEIVLSLPLEPRGAPLNDAGSQALLTGATLEQNLQRLHWSLGRIGGYAGVTGALGAMRGERFAASADSMAFLLREITSRGLYYVDAGSPENGATRINVTPRALAFAHGRFVDLVVDEPPTRAEIDRQLAVLEAVARERGSAVGLVSAPRPTSIGRVAIWAAGLSDRGVALVPVSAIALPPTEVATAGRP